MSREPAACALGIAKAIKISLRTFFSFCFALQGSNPGPHPRMPCALPPSSETLKVIQERRAGANDREEQERVLPRLPGLRVSS